MLFLSIIVIKKLKRRQTIGKFAAYVLLRVGTKIPLVNRGTFVSFSLN